MFIVRFLRFVCGYVRFQVTGVFIERFLNLASRNGINLWNGTKTETQYTGYTLMKHYKKLRPFAKKTGVHMQIEERFGWRMWRRKRFGRSDRRTGARPPAGWRSSPPGP